MGEEYGETAPFQFFTDHIDEKIAVATAEGRRREFSAFASFSAEDVPDPQDEETFLRSKLTREGDEAIRALYVRLLDVRRELPAGRDADAVDCDAAVPWLRVRRGPFTLAGNFAETPASVPVDGRRRARPRHPRRHAPGQRPRRPARARGSARAMTAPPDIESAREVWPGRPFPLGATWDGHGTNFALFSENAAEVDALPVRRRGQRGADPGRRADGPHLALLPAGRPRGPVLRLPRRRRLRPVRRAPLQPEQAPHRPLRQGDRGAGPLGRGERRCPTCPTARSTPTSSPTTRTTPRRSRSRSSSTRASTGRATRRRGRRGTRRSSTRPTSRATRCSTRPCARTCAAPTPGSRPRRRSATSSASA